MSFLTKAKTRKGEEREEIENPKALADAMERRGNVFQAVRVRLWYGLPQRIAHRPMVIRWCNGEMAEASPPPAVPDWIGTPMERDNSEEARMDRAMWLLQRGKVNQAQVSEWPERWRSTGKTLGYLNADGTLRFTGAAHG